ncbi:MAG: hypothetical protein V4667_04765 [Bacteroidota bacterium]
MSGIQVLFLIVVVLFLNSCSKSNQCECNTPFVLGNYYQPGDIVSNRGSCWMYREEANPSIVSHNGNIPRDIFPDTQDLWINICKD